MIKFSIRIMTFWETSCGQVRTNRSHKFGSKLNKNLILIYLFLIFTHFAGQNSKMLIQLHFD